jgi:hypothetical protein
MIYGIEHDQAREPPPPKIFQFFVSKKYNFGQGFKGGQKNATQNKSKSNSSSAAIHKERTRDL